MTSFLGMGQKGRLQQTFQVQGAAPPNFQTDNSQPLQYIDPSLQWGPPIDNSVSFDNGNVGGSSGGNKGQTNGVLGMDANSAIDPALYQMGAQPESTGRATEQLGTVHKIETAKSSSVEHRVGQYSVSNQHKFAPATSPYANGIHHPQPQGMRLRVPLNSMHPAFLNPGNPAFHQYLPIPPTALYPPNNPPHTPMAPALPQPANRQPYAPIAQAVSRPVNQVPNSSKQAASGAKKLKITRAPHRSYTADDFKGIWIGGKKKKGKNGGARSWDIETEANHYPYFLKYHGRPALPKETDGLTPFRQRSEAVKSLPAPERELLVDFIKANKYWLKHDRLPNPPNVVLVQAMIDLISDDEDENEDEDNNEDETEDENDSVNQSGKYQMTASKKRARNEEEDEAREAPAQPIKKVRPNPLPSDRPQNPPKPRRHFNNAKVQSSFWDFEPVDKFLTSIGQPSIMALVNNHLASIGHPPIRLIRKAGTAVPDSGSPALDDMKPAASQDQDQQVSTPGMAGPGVRGVNRSSGSVASSQAESNSYSPVDGRTADLGSSESSCHRPVSFGKRKAGIDDDEEQRDYPEMAAPHTKKIRTGNTVMDESESNKPSAPPRKQKAPAKRRPASKNKQRVTEAHPADVNRQSPAVGSPGFTSFAPPPTSLGEQSVLGGDGYESYDVSDGSGQLMAFEDSNKVNSLPVEPAGFDVFGPVPPHHGEQSVSVSHDYQHPSDALEGRGRDMPFGPSNQVRSWTGMGSEGFSGPGVSVPNNSEQTWQNFDWFMGDTLANASANTAGSGPGVSASNNGPQISEGEIDWESDGFFPTIPVANASANTGGSGPYSQDTHSVPNGDETVAAARFLFEDDMPPAQW